MNHRMRIGVLRGGPSSEYEVSLKTGAAILEAMRNSHSDRYEAKDILVDRAGLWHHQGLPFGHEDSHRHFDAIFIALHGEYGEDGKVQSILEHHGVPFTGSGSLASAIGMNKILTKQSLKHHGIRSPYWKEITSAEVEDDLEGTAQKLFTTFILPAVIKPSRSGSSIGVSIARQHSDIAPALLEAARHGHSIIIEEFIPGIEATCGVIEGFRGQDLYALPPVEIRHGKGFFDYAAKYGGSSEEVVPASFSKKIKGEIEDLARKVHQILGLRHYSRTDFIIHPRRGIYVLETNTLPGLTPESLLPKSLQAVGSSLPEMADHLVKLTLKLDR